MPSRKKTYSSVIGLVVLLAVIAAIIYLKSEQIVPVIVEEVPVAVTEQPRLLPHAKPIMKVEDAIAIQNNRNNAGTVQTNEAENSNDMPETALGNNSGINNNSVDSEQDDTTVWETQEDIITADTVDKEADGITVETESLNNE